MKICEHCGEPYAKRPKEAYWQFDERKFCSSTCANKEVHCSCGWSRFPNNADTPYKVHQMEMLERAVRNEIAEAMHERGELEGSTEVCWAWEDAEAIARGGKEQ